MSKLSEERQNWLKEYAQGVVSTYSTEFSRFEDRFPDWKRLIARFDNAVATVLRMGSSHFHEVDEAHNELCLALAILANDQPRFGSLQ